MHFGNAIKLRPRAYWILQAYGVAKLHANKLTEAEALLREAEEIKPNHGPTLIGTGRLKEWQRDLEAAEDYYRRAIDADPNNSFAYYRLAKLLYREGDIEQAYEVAKAALATNPLDDRNKSLVQELKTECASLVSQERHQR